jgi:hypothetical protein
MRGLWRRFIQVLTHSRACRDGHVDAFTRARHVRRAGARWPERACCGVEQEQAVPGHGGLFPVEAVAGGGARGCIQPPKVSMTTMCPPQHGQGGRGSDGSTGSDGASGGDAASSSRARSMLDLRVLLASRP